MKYMAFIITVMLTLWLAGCGGGTGGSAENSGNTDTGSSQLKRVNDSSDVLRTIKNVLLKQYGKTVDYSNHPVIYETTSVVTDSGAAANSVSVTNVQEAGVDEADRLKTDGQYLFAAAVDKPAIMVFSADARANKLAELTLNTGEQYGALKGIYLRQQQLIALSSPYRFGIYPMPVIAEDSVAAYYSEQSHTQVFGVDISNASQPLQTLKLQLDGELVSSRMIGDKLYLVTRQAVRLNGLVYPHDAAQAAANEAQINAAQLTDFLPGYAINEVDQGKIFSAADCFTTDYSKDSSALSLVSVLVLDTTDATPRPQGQCFLGDIETLYASPAALYLATTSYAYSTDENGNAVYSGTMNTDLHRFDLSSGNITYSGSGRVNGHLGWYQDLKPFRLSEYNDTLRVITYTGRSVAGTQSPAHLYNLQLNAADAELDIVGQLPNTQRPALLGKPGEQVYATRFVGERGYLVTYRLTDPLYILDLSDPRDPFIAGELEIEGYSDYLHPVGNNTLLGVGKDALVAGGDEVLPGVTNTEVVEVARGAWYQGVKLSLIDVSNPQQPFEKQKLILGKRGSETAVSQTHHALTSLLRGDTLRVALPLRRNEEVNASTVSERYNPSMPQYYYGWTQDELTRFDIDLNSGVMTQRPSLIAQQAVDNAESYPHSAHWSADRSVMIGDRVYYLHGDKVLTADW